jgi:hypothetical protein
MIDSSMRTTTEVENRMWRVHAWIFRSVVLTNFVYFALSVSRQFDGAPMVRLAILIISSEITESADSVPILFGLFFPQLRFSFPLSVFLPRPVGIVERGSTFSSA